MARADALPEGEITAEQAFHAVFWPEYPRKVHKEEALKAWNGLHLRDTDEATVKSIMERLRWFIREEWAGWSTAKIPYAATWIGRAPWKD